MKIKFLKAFHGDSILISFEEQVESLRMNRNILIDGGPENTFERYEDKRRKKKIPGELKLLIESLKQKGEVIDLLILTHVDDDHIAGILKWFEDINFSKDMIGKVWFNSGRLIYEYFQRKESEENDLKLNLGGSLDTGIAQGISFEEFILENNLWERKLIKFQDEIIIFELKFRILSPDVSKLEKFLYKWIKEAPELLTAMNNDYNVSLKDHVHNDKFKEDDKPHNGSSIAFIMTYNAQNFLFFGDAHPSTLVKGLRYFGFSEETPLRAVLVKVSHHGSRGNTSSELLNLIDCDKFIISSNGDYYALPDKQCLARIINSKPNVKLYFNYPELISKIFSEQDYKDFKFKAIEVIEDFT